MGKLKGMNMLMHEVQNALDDLTISLSGNENAYIVMEEMKIVASDSFTEDVNDLFVELRVRYNLLHTSLEYQSNVNIDVPVNLLELGDTKLIASFIIGNLYGKEED